MSPLEIALLVVGILLVLGVGFYLFSIIYAAWCIYDATLKRKTPDQWGRSQKGETELHEEMFAIGRKWQSGVDKYKKDVHIVRDGLNLYGEYYDLGFDKAVLILSGRTDSLCYGYFFAKPYCDSGYNVLVIDARAHGKSDGKYNTFGFEEGKDVVEWLKFLQNEIGVEKVLIHALCIGAAAGTYALVSKDCPSLVEGIITEGMFVNFGESMKNHLIERKKLWFPIMQSVDFWMKHYGGHSMMKGPIDWIDKVRVPVLMLQSKEDKYSTYQNANRLYDACGSEKKKIVLFEKGGHSLIRITNMEKYDTEILVFIKTILN